ncbi:MAG: hypothetical protein ACJAXQ_001687 [Parvibaculaceae bacterium]|jgi:hypothetical protein
MAYRPTWRNRRKLVFISLVYIALTLPAIVFWAPAGSRGDSAVYGLLSLAGLVITYYLIGPSVELVKLSLKKGL